MSGSEDSPCSGCWAERESKRFALAETTKSRGLKFKLGGVAVLLHWKELKLLWAVVVFSLKCLLAVSPAAFRSGDCLD